MCSQEKQSCDCLAYDPIGAGTCRRSSLSTVQKFLARGAGPLALFRRALQASLPLQLLQAVTDQGPYQIAFAAAESLRLLIQLPVLIRVKLDAHRSLRLTMPAETVGVERQPLSCRWVGHGTPIGCRQDCAASPNR